MEGGQIHGHAMLSKMQAPFPALGLAPVAVDPPRQGRGIGAGLIRHALSLAREEGWVGVFVLGDPRYYRRFGFGVRLAAGFASPYSGPHFMAIALADVATLSGRVEYAPAFTALA